MSEFSHDVAHLEKNVDGLLTLLETFVRSNKREDIVNYFYKKGFTTPAEYKLIAAALESMLQQAQALAANYEAVQKGVAMVVEGQ
ncbi:hypothetical protein AWB78_02383 [Caballeronia calidae]|uniref:Uncharacterized protein n=1 Tax=Caballeronia calidae TaxID=1777139 RepID=A0A158B7T1_9BURK|nr:hypothetical protein [Caballeronia calidae]SAK66103.1 hypothetical protein AWB78_02383 [Caballeronia calidae]